MTRPGSSSPTRSPGVSTGFTDRATPTSQADPDLQRDQGSRRRGTCLWRRRKPATGTPATISSWRPPRTRISTPGAGGGRSPSTTATAASWASATGIPRCASGGIRYTIERVDKLIQHGGDELRPGLSPCGSDAGYRVHGQAAGRTATRANDANRGRQDAGGCSWRGQIATECLGLDGFSMQMFVGGPYEGKESTMKKTIGVGVLVSVDVARHGAGSIEDRLQPDRRRRGGGLPGVLRDAINRRRRSRPRATRPSARR